MRVRRTFAFIDLSGFTALTASRGDEEAVDVLTMFRYAVRQVCSRRAVRVAKWLGDGAMLVSVEPRPAVETVLELQHRARTGSRPLAVRCGISTGAVILLEGDDYIGHSVNVAARLGDLAEAHEILAVPELVPSLPAWGAVLSGREVKVRGLDGVLSVACLGLAERSADSPTDPICGLPLGPDVAFARAVSAGATVLFCSESCLDTWRNRTGAGDTRVVVDVVPEDDRGSSRHPSPIRPPAR
ncbi:MAG TPA: adenylate/guanylate cyclase domain-containing protein [Acidimicrobiales bacterium]|nr:adenylate/guanylate cyclase domain-containing protein [Acidimicrobiales bacterium]